MSYRDTFQFWLEDDYFDDATKQELLAIRNNEAKTDSLKIWNLVQAVYVVLSEPEPIV